MARRQSSGRRMKGGSEMFFNSTCEEMTVLTYVANMADSWLTERHPDVVFGLAASTLGLSTIHRLVSEVHDEAPLCQDTSDFYGWMKSTLEEKDIVRIIADMILPEIDRRLATLPIDKEEEFTLRCTKIRQTFNLTDEEMEVLLFFYLVSVYQPLNNWLCRPNLDFSFYATFRNLGSIILGQDKGALIASPAEGPLFKTSLLEWQTHNGCIDIEGWPKGYLSGFYGTEVSHQFFTSANDTCLILGDFDIPEEERLVLDTIMSEQKGCNILFYGPPGTGKSSLAKAVAKHYGRELLSVNIPDDDNHKERLRAVYATFNIADRDGALILVDEADELLNTWDSFFTKSKTNKSWVNGMLETHGKKAIWITNRTGQIDPSTMRRFTFTMEFRKVTTKGRLHILKHELKKRDMERVFADDELNDLCKTYPVDAGGIVNAMSICDSKAHYDKDAAMQIIRTVLKNHELATQGETMGNPKQKTMQHYSLEGVHVSRSLEEIVAVARQYLHSDKGNAHVLSLLLYGPPGTGKTEFVHYLGNILDREVVLKRSSDIKSMWVGETEANIARAFHEAQKERGILFFDEADSFLYPRQNANHSWEKSFTNEILAQLDSYTGIVIFATNDIDGLDHAALRRFRFKIEFRTLTPEGNTHFYQKLLAPMVNDGSAPSEQETQRIRGMSNLTPGDFAVVKEQFLFVEGAAITHGKLIASLMTEVGHKQAEKREIGFLKAI